MNSFRRIFLASTIALVALGYGVAAAQDGEETADSNAQPPEQGDASADGNQPAPDAEPPPTESQPAAKDEGVVDVDALRQEYLKLRDRLFRSRARAAAVASTMYSSRISIYLDYASGRYYTVGRATVRLDGANVFDDSDGAIAKDKAARFEGYIAPGRHLVSVRIEAAGKDDDRFTSIVENTFVVQAPAGKDLVVRVKAKDDGNVPYKWKKEQKGSYRLHLDVDLKSEKPKKGKHGRIRRASK